MDLTSANLIGMYTGFNVRFNEWYNRTKLATFWDKLSMVQPSITSQETYGWMADLPRMREWVGPRQLNSMSSRAMTVVNKDYESTVTVPRNAVADDTYGLYNPNVAMLAYSAAKWPDDILYEMLAANTELGFDGKPTFADDHPNLRDGGVTTYDNDYALALDVTNAATVRGLMASRLGENGKPLGLFTMGPPTIIHGPALANAARQVANGQFIPGVGVGGAAVGGVSNVWQGAYNLIEIAEMDATPTRWMMADLNMPLMPWVHQRRQDPQFVTLFNPTDPNVFFNKEFIMGTDSRGNCAPGFWPLVARSTP